MKEVVETHEILSLQAELSKALRQGMVMDCSQMTFRITSSKPSSWDLPFQKKNGWKILKLSSPMKSPPFRWPEQDWQAGTFFRVCVELKSITR